MPVDLLASGIYSISETARLLGTTPQQVRSWIRGNYRSKVGPIIENQLADQGGRIAISFLNLIEARFVHAFKEFGFSMQAIRVFASEARRYLNSPHPFALEFMFDTDGRTIFVKEILAQGDDPSIFNLKNRMYGFWPILHRELKSAIRYEDGVARSWHPAPDIAPSVVVDPFFAFGQPILADSKVPTSALFDAYVAEEESEEVVAEWFEVPPAHVCEAVRFEQEVYRAAAA